MKVGHNRDGSVRVYQPPGESNALGRIRFNFPNPFLVYQHDTPDKNLFAQDKRALSHGCMRVQIAGAICRSNPLPVAAERRITRRRGSGAFMATEERTINLKHPIPVHVTYQTAFVDKSGSSEFAAGHLRLDAAPEADARRRAPDRRHADRAPNTAAASPSWPGCRRVKPRLAGPSIGAGVLAAANALAPHPLRIAASIAPWALVTQA